MALLDRMSSLKLARARRCGALAAACLGAAGCSGAGAGTPGAARAEPGPALRFEGVQFRVYRGPELVAQGLARSASFQRSTGDVSAERIQARFPEEADRPETRIDAAHGAGNVRARRFAGSGGVRSIQPGQIATTEEAHWSEADGIVRGDQPIVIRRGRLEVRGPGFTLDPRDGRIVIAGGAQAESTTP